MYTAKLGGLIPIGTVTVQDLTSAAVGLRFIATQKLIIRRLVAVIQTATVSSGGIVVKANKRPTPNSSAGQTVSSSMTIATAKAAGQKYYANLTTPLTLDVGDELAIEVTTAAAGGGAAGAAWIFASEVEESPEQIGNVSNMNAG